jgi:ABC-type transport system involved in multi-copper enzyme maturation permease subunit
VLNAELTKVRTIRSTRWALLVAVVACVGLGYAVSLSLRVSFPQLPAQQRHDWDPLYATFYSLTIGQLALVVFGAIVAGSEYSSGTILPSLTVVPRRGQFYAAKLGSAALTAAGAALVAVTGTFFAAQWALGPHGTSAAGPGVPQAALGACCYLILICALSAGLATALRSQAMTLAILLPLLLLDSQGLGNVPVLRSVIDYLPDQAGAVIMHLSGPAGTRFGRPYGPWTGMGIMAGWTAAAVGAGYLVLLRSDVTGARRGRPRRLLAS